MHEHKVLAQICVVARKEDSRRCPMHFQTLSCPFLIQIEKFTHHFNLLTSIRSLVTDPEWETLYPEWPAGC